MKLSVKKFADWVGVSVRTLHYYDEIGLLSPDDTDETTGYRYYGENAFSRMQEILFYRELDFSLKEIAEMLASPSYDKQKALRGQRELLLLKKERLERILEAIDRVTKGEGTDMKAFDNSKFDKAKEAYRDEVENRWGSTAAYREHRQKTAGYTKETWQQIGQGLDEIFAAFAQARAEGVRETDGAAIALARRLQHYITETQYTCTDEILLCLGEMYVGDERFTASIDKHGAGTAAFVHGAIRACCGKE